MIMLVDHQREAEPLREMLNVLLGELNILCHRHQLRGEESHEDESAEAGGAAAFRLRQFTDLAEWLERQLEESPLDTDAIRQRQVELSSFLIWCDRRDLLTPFLGALGVAPKQGIPDAPILSTIGQCSWGAADVLRLSSANPQILHYLILQARDQSAAQEAWRQLKQCEDYLSSDVLVHIILNSGFAPVIRDAWRLLQPREDLLRRSIESLAKSAPLLEIREQARSLIEG
ncbi:TPA: hypothetical protein DCL30_02020 [Candidatus Peribacteria bacterium]|nr:MAG: hypothetical protein A3J91_04255 [Candidatus Peribacteria bacterium RIFOXYC2_FULL_58_10]OGJ85251.1 MAG: hypothetical protein A2529_02195 [Candidatus Peribacteria bacterium RIFOXYD2_FULL_58_15]HAI98303.1 hypothetical protein [Candidatus Peribacteria bacterium]HAS33947.1 hypothetical protein [Candidatus Peribacteria bacterium]